MAQLVKNGTYIRLRTITLLDCHCAGRPFGEYRPSSAALGLQLFQLNYSSNMQAHTHTAHESGHLKECVYITCADIQHTKGDCIAVVHKGDCIAVVHKGDCIAVVHKGDCIAVVHKGDCIAVVHKGDCIAVVHKGDCIAVVHEMYRSHRIHT